MDSMRGVFQGFDISGSALQAEMQRSEIVSANLANMHVTRTADGEPYRRKSVLFEELLAAQPTKLGSSEQQASGVRVSGIHEDHTTPFFESFDPGHPDANEQGFVLRSNVDMFRELMDMTIIRRSFEANLAALRTYRGMLQSTVSNFRS
jgi:flagellar basal-body rod protein FlgC